MYSGPHAHDSPALDLIDDARNVPLSQTVRYFGEPRSIATINTPKLIRIAERADAVIEVTCAVGDTILDDTTVINIRGAKGPLSEHELLGSIQLKRERTFEQDPKYAIRLLVDIAIKALSPAINDPTTAVQAIDQIEDLMRRLARYHLDAGHSRDVNGVVRVIFPMPTWEDYLHLHLMRLDNSGPIRFK